MKSTKLFAMVLAAVLLVTLTLSSVKVESKQSSPEENPLRLIASDIGKYVQLNWDLNPGSTARGFNVYRTSNSPENWERLTETPISSTSFVDYSAPRPALVLYRVTSVQESGETPIASVIKIGTQKIGEAAITDEHTAALAVVYSKDAIITDSQLTNSGAMSLTQIQTFLSNHGSALANYSVDGRTAAQHIYDACQTHGINPQVVLVTLQKEKGLIRSSSANPNNYAMGWSTWDSSVSGFADQIYWGTRQFKLYYNNLGSYGWTVGQAKTVSDGVVTAANTATAGLYVYTPWIGQGGGGQIGVGGNYLFWDLWQNTFGFNGTVSSAIVEHPNGWIYPTGSSNYQYLSWLQQNPAFGNQFHLAQDMANALGNPVHAIDSGDVILSTTLACGYGGSSGQICDSVNGYRYGGALIIQHRAKDGTWFTALYGHLDSPLPVGRHVFPGDHVGFSNNWNPPHVHFGIRPGPNVTSSTPYRGYTPSTSQLDGFTNPIAFLANFSACKNGTSVNFRPNNTAPVHPNGTLIKSATDGTVYLLRNGQKQGIVSPDVLRNLYPNGGFDFKDVITVAQDEFNSYPIGSTISSQLPSNGKTHAEGRLIRRATGGEISIVTDNGKRRGFVSSSVFLNLGYLFCNVVDATNANYDSYPVGDPVTGTGTASCSGPGSFSLNSPGNGQSLPTTTSVTLSWGASANASSYDVFLGTSSNPPLIATQTGTSRSVSVTPGQTYFWKIVAKVSCGTATFATSVVSFSVQQQTYTINVSASPSTGGSVSGGGTFTVGSSRTVTATANSGFSFSNWTENGSFVSSSPSFTFTLNSNRSLVANFTQNPVNYTINVSASPSTGGSVSGGGTFTAGSSRTVTATANSGFSFSNWTENGSVVSSSPSFTFTLNSNRNLVANFTQNPVNYTINVSASPSTGGSVSGGGTFTAGSSRTVAATANSGFSFSNWTENGSVVSSLASYTFTLNADRNLVANFATSSPAGPKIAYTRVVNNNQEVFVMNGDGSGQLNLTNNTADDYQAAWSPDNTRIAFASNRTGQHEIYVMNADGSNPINLTQNGGLDYRPTWSADGQKILFSSDRAGIYELYLMNADGTNQTRLTFSSGGAIGGDWSSDGQKIVFMNFRDGAWNIDSMNADGTGKVGLTSGSAFKANPKWSPDRSKILYESLQDGLLEIYVMNADGSNQTRLTSLTSISQYPDWAGDGQKIAFASDRDGYQEIYVMNADGSNATRLTQNQSFSLEPAYQSSPNTPRVNFALVTNGGAASASSTLDAGRAPLGAINGDRTGRHWATAPETGSGWHDATSNAHPDWLQVDFNGVQAINEINVYTLQDNFENPVEPNSAMTFSIYGITAFEVQYWNGTSWLTVPGGSVTGNNKVWRQFSSLNIQTSKIRVLVNSALAGFSRIVEVEAWGTPVTTVIRNNFALASNGGVASASSTLDAGRAPLGAINGDRTGRHWATAPETGSGWHDATSNTHPDWVQVDFNGVKTIEEIDVYTLQDNFENPTEPNSDMTFSIYGITAFEVQYWNGTSWVTVPGGSVTGNNKVWRQFNSLNIQTSKIRVLVNSALAGFSRIVEVEAWGTPVTTVTRTNVALASNGGLASASSTLDAGRAPLGAINGDRTGRHWATAPETGSGWHDATSNAHPDWLQVDFNGIKTIEEIDVYTLQDNFENPTEPNSDMTFSIYGITAFEVQYWNGTSWVTVPGGSVTGNNKVWRQFGSLDIQTSKIRVLVNSALAGFSRIVEVEAWGRAATPSRP